SPTQELNIKKDSIVRIHQHDELLSFVRRAFSSPDYPDTSYNFAGGNPITRHGMTSLAMGLTEMAACPVEKGLKGFSAPARPGVEAVPTRTCASQAVEFHCASVN